MTGYRTAPTPCRLYPVGCIVEQRLSGWWCVPGDRCPFSRDRVARDNLSWPSRRSCAGRVYARTRCCAGLDEVAVEVSSSCSSDIWVGRGVISLVDTTTASSRWVTSPRDIRCSAWRRAERTCTLTARYIPRRRDLLGPKRRPIRNTLPWCIPVRVPWGRGGGAE